MLNYREGSFVLTNSIPVISNRLRFSLNMTIEENFQKRTNDKSRMTNTEVVGINLSNYPFDIRQYKGTGIVYPLRGYTFIFYRGTKDSIAYLETHDQNNSYNLAAAFHSQNRYAQGRYCNFNYVNTTSVVDIELDFNNMIFKSAVNGLPCHSYKIDRRLLPENKATFSFMGYSTNVGPVQIKVNDLSIYKLSNTTLISQTPFHANTENFIRSVETFDPGHAKNVSLSNLLLINVSLKEKDREAVDSWKRSR